MSHNKKRLLFLTRFDPRSPTGGGGLRISQLCNILDRQFSLEIIVVGSERETATFRSNSTIEVFSQHSMLSQNPVVEKFRRKLWRFRKRQHPLVEGFAPLTIRNKVAEKLKSTDYDLAIISEAAMGGFAELFVQEAIPFVYDAHNVESKLRLQLSTKQNPFQSPRRFREIEKYLYQKAAGVWVCSEKDSDDFAVHFGERKSVEVIPNCIDLDYYRPARSRDPNDKPQQPHLVYPGAYSYYPNEYAASELIDKILPEVQKRYPHAKLTLIGRDPTKAMMKAADNPEIEITGGVEDILPYLSAHSIFTVPLKHGSGTRLKILEAFACKLPVVCTQKACEGIECQDGKDVLLAESPDEFSNHIQTLWSNPELSEQVTAAAFQLVKTKYSWDAVCPKITESIEGIIDQD